MLRNIESVDPEKNVKVEEEHVYHTSNVDIPDPDQLNFLTSDMKIEISHHEKNTNKQTTFANDSIFAKSEGEETVFAISVDGSNHSSYGFELVTKEFLKPTSRLIIVHIFSFELDKYYNYQNKRDTVLYNYSTKLVPYKTQSTFLAENREPRVYHALEQVNRIVSRKECNYLIIGYYGIKGPKGSNEELSKGISYALGNAITPVIMVKELSLRCNTKSGGFRWCFIFDKQYSNCIRSFLAFSELVNPEKDFVYGFSLLPSYINFDLNKREFHQEIKLRGIKNFEYEAEEYKKDPGKIVLEKVNHCQEPFDFVVIYNNANRHRDNPENNENIDIIKYCVSNICFVNSIK